MSRRASRLNEASKFGHRHRGYFWMVFWVASISSPQKTRTYIRAKADVNR
jgi:hypothetical protein